MRGRGRLAGWIAAAVLAAGTAQCAHVLIHLEPERPIAEKTAVLVLPGLRNSAKGFRAMSEWYPRQGYDVFIPDYYSTEGLDWNVANLNKFIYDNDLKKYGKVYVFTYLMGGWTLNRYLMTHRFPNLEKIIYDRSPIQEQVAGAVLVTMPGIVKAIFGDTVEEFHETPYPSLPKGDRTIGIIAECRATPLARMHRRMLRPVGEEDYAPEAFDQEHDDLMYVFLHHDEMYYSFDVIGDEILTFFETGRFSDDARRDPCTENAFE
jgi:hypothetical protein